MTMKNGTWPTSVIGARSFNGSNGIVLTVIGAIVTSAEAPINSV